jgi:hypothetical protein
VLSEVLGVVSAFTVLDVESVVSAVTVLSEVLAVVSLVPAVTVVSVDSGLTVVGAVVPLDVELV